MALERGMEAGAGAGAGAGQLALRISWDALRDPALLLAAVRKRLGKRKFLLWAERGPGSEEEENYVKLFEEFGAGEKVVVATDWEGGAADSPMEFLDASVICPTEHYNIGRLSVKEGAMLPVTGEYLQSLMDYTILNEAKKVEIHKWLDVACPPARQLFTEREWPAAVTEHARSIFIYPEPGIPEHAFQFTWPNLRLVLLHNGDNTVSHEVFKDFLERHPKVVIWAENNMDVHDRVRTVPLLEQNRRWREGTPEYDPPIQLSRRRDRDTGFLFPFCSGTNMLRARWVSIAYHMREKKELELSTKLPMDDYLERLEESVAIVCPPGNGVDTHRHWESLYKGAWAVVEDNAHTQNLLREYPSLPLIPIKDIEDLRPLPVPVLQPCPFHPLLLREYWAIRVRSHVC